MPSVPPYPWFTYLAITLCWLIAIGGLWAILRLWFLLFARALGTIPRLLDLGCLHLFGAPLTSAGTAHWALPREVQRAGLLRSEGISLAAWQETTLHAPSGSHVLVMGPPRSGKSWGLAMPVLRTWPGAVVVSDLRHELFDQTGGARAAYGPVYGYDPAHAQHSCHLNVLDSLRWGTPQAYGDAQRICHHLVVPQRDREPGPFDRPAVALLTGIVLHLHDLGGASFPGVVTWMQEPSRSQREKLDEMLHRGNPHVAAAARRVFDESDRYRSIVWDAALAPLAVFLDPTIASHSRTSDLDWQDFLSGRQPVSLFLCMQFRDIERLGVILGALVEALIALLGSPERTPRHRTLLLLDELANLGTLTELERGVSYLQGSGVQLMACVQNLPQLVSLYGPQSPLLASIHTQVHYRPLDRLTSEYLEAMLGPQTVMAQSWGETQGVSSSGFSSSRSAGQQETGRPLLTAAELRALPADSALVLASGCPPVLARKLGVLQPAVATRVLRIANAHREATATLAAAAAILVALIPALAPVVQQPPGLRPQPTLAQAPPLTQAPVFSTSATAPPTASSPTATVTQAASRAPAWRIYMREPYHRAGQYSPTLARDFPTRDACVQAMLDGAEPMLRALHNAGSQKVFNYTLDVDTTQPDRLTWTVNYHGKSKLGGAPLNPDNAPDVHERWCAEEQKG